MAGCFASARDPQLKLRVVRASHGNPSFI